MSLLEKEYISAFCIREEEGALNTKKKEEISEWSKDWNEWEEINKNLVTLRSSNNKWKAEKKSNDRNDHF